MFAAITNFVIYSFARTFFFIVPARTLLLELLGCILVEKFSLLSSDTFVKHKDTNKILFRRVLIT